MCLQFLCYVALLSLVDCYSHVLCLLSDNRVLNKRFVLLDDQPAMTLHLSMFVFSLEFQFPS